MSQERGLVFTDFAGECHRAHRAGKQGEAEDDKGDVVVRVEALAKELHIGDGGGLGGICIRNGRVLHAGSGCGVQLRQAAAVLRGCGRSFLHLAGIADEEFPEAAAQGLIAGINAVRKIQGKEAFILDRASSYIGTLIDDLVTKGCSDPYRMMTSRSEYRLLLRQDNADIRLTDYGYEIGLISEERYEKFKNKLELIKQERERVESVTIPPSEAINKVLVSRETAPMKTGIRLAELIKRPQLDYECLTPFDKTRPVLPWDVFEQVEIDLKYEGYIKRQQAKVDEMRRLEVKKIPIDIDYDDVYSLRLEAREKLKKVRPESVGQASRISGVSPSDISVLLIHLSKNERK